MGQGEKFPGLEFLAKKYPKRSSRFINEERKRRGKNGVEKSEEKIADWLLGINMDRDDPVVLGRIKQYYHKKYVIKPDEIPDTYFELQRRLAREQGHGDIEITEERKRQLTEVVISDQESSLDTWIDYLASPDAGAYPMWSKYWAFWSMVKLSAYDKEKPAFGKRGKGTTAPFPDLNREALSYVVNIISKKVEKKPIEEPEDNSELQKILQSENFGDLYAYAIEKVTPGKETELQNTRGEWVKYEQGSDHMPLVASLQGHGTGWCTAGESTARVQLQGGDFYVYYSYDDIGKPSIPRVAIRMQENRIAEVRGIAIEQNLDPYIGPVVEKKLKEFGHEGDVYTKKSADMRRLTALENKAKSGQELTKDDLTFLYEINASIEGFGFQEDPRIKELRGKRNSEIDMSIFFECAPEQIARTPEGINENTKAYVGKLEGGVFQKLPENVEYIYRRFPGKRIRRERIKIGGKTADQLFKELEQAGIIISDNAKYMMKSPKFTTSTKAEKAILIRVTVAALGFSRSATIDQIYEEAQKLGFELCPAEVGPHYRLQYQDQHKGEWIVVGMKTISNSAGSPRVFSLEHRAVGLWFGGHGTELYDWGPGDEFVFSLRKSES